MPNHCTNHIRIRGEPEKVKTLFERMVKTNKNGELEVDFNAVKAMPKELKRTQSPVTVVPTRQEADDLNSKIVKDKWNGDITIVAITKEQETNRLKKYGATNWYDWANKYWGTKWGAYDVSQAEMVGDRVIVLEFNTAWNTPDGLIRELEMQGFQVDGYWHEEGGEEGEIGEFDGYVDKTIEVGWY